MSLDISLVLGPEGDGACPECGSVRHEVYTANITHNLSRMADAAGLYKVLWRPEEFGYFYAHQIAPILREGLMRLRENPAHFRTYDAENQWGTYEQFLPFVAEYLTACVAYPLAHVSVSR